MATIFLGILCTTGSFGCTGRPDIAQMDLWRERVVQMFAQVIRVVARVVRLSAQVVPASARIVHVLARVIPLSARVVRRLARSG
jgi:hypothetical protein